MPGTLWSGSGQRCRRKSAVYRGALRCSDRLTDAAHGVTLASTAGRSWPARARPSRWRCSMPASCRFAIRRSTGEPRAPLCLMGVCFDCLVEVDGRQNVQSCMVDVREGMNVGLQHGARRVAGTAMTHDLAHHRLPAGWRVGGARRFAGLASPAARRTGGAGGQIYRNVTHGSRSRRRARPGLPARSGPGRRAGALVGRCTTTRWCGTLHLTTIAALQDGTLVPDPAGTR